MKSVRITDELYAAAESTASVMHRSIAMQLEHWARLGQKLEARHANAMEQLLATEDMALRAAKTNSQQEFARAVKRGNLANTAGMFFSADFFKDVSVDTGRHVL